MLIQLSDDTRNLLAQSLPLMERGKDRLIDGLGAYLRAVDPEASDHSELVAMMLTEMLIGRSAELLETRALKDAADLGCEHLALGIEGRHYSRFGDALSPVIRDVLGPKVPRAVLAAWGDAFWAIIRTGQVAGEGRSAVTGLSDLSAAGSSSGTTRFRLPA